MDITPEKFQKTITGELKVVQDRVRHLIGNANWGEEGRYKEVILRNVIRRFLPATISLGTGFIAKKENGEIKISKQIDIIIYDNTYPVLFSEDDFIITTPANVKGIIEVKTKQTPTKIVEAMKNATTNGSLVSREIFNGIFAYERGNIKVNDRGINTKLEEALKDSKGFVNHVCLGEDIFIKFHPNLDTQNNCSNGYYNIYNIEKLSFSYFISNIVENIFTDEMVERLWFLYSLENGKNARKIRDICI